MSEMPIAARIFTSDYVPQRQCSRCKIFKSLTEFPKSNTAPGGLHYNCKVCIGESQKRWVAKPGVRERRNARQYAYQATGIGHRNWCAAQIVRFAVRMGALIKRPCKICGSTKVQAHHEDYMKPLEVEWLCKKHHVEADRLRREAEQPGSELSSASYGSAKRSNSNRSN